LDHVVAVFVLGVKLRWKLLLLLPHSRLKPSANKSISTYSTYWLKGFEVIIKQQEKEDVGVLSDLSDPDETQIVSFDGVFRIPDEYVPQNEGNAQNTHMFFRAGKTPLSPVLGSGMICRKLIQPVSVTPKAKMPVKAEPDDEDLN